MIIRKENVYTSTFTADNIIICYYIYKHFTLELRLCIKSSQLSHNNRLQNPRFHHGVGNKKRNQGRTEADVTSIQRKKTAPRQNNDKKKKKTFKSLDVTHCWF